MTMSLSLVSCGGKKTTESNWNIKILNENGEDIGARRLHAVFEQLLEDISFNAGGDPDMPPFELKIDGNYVKAHLSGENARMDMHRYIL